MQRSIAKRKPKVQAMQAPRERAREHGATARGWETSAPWISALVAVALAAAMATGVRDFLLDDAYIHLAYAKSLGLGDGPSYNPGDWETGCSSPLWVLLLAVWPLPRDPSASPVVAVELLGLLLHGATAWLGARVTMALAHDGERSRFGIALLGGLLVASTPTALQAAVSGMEVPLAAALILGTTAAVLRGRTTLSAVLAALSVWARPEALVYVCTLAGVLLLARTWPRVRSRETPEHATTHERERPDVRPPLLALVGAAAAMLAWVAYAMLVSGHPFPNAQYVKGMGGGLAGLDYVANEVLPWQPWLVGLGGVVLLGLALLGDVRERRIEGPAIAIAVLVTVIAIAITRPLHPGTLFYESRYFAIVACAPAVLVARGVRGCPRWLAAVLLVPVAVVQALTAYELAALSREHADDVHALHTRVAHALATTLPGDAIVGVEAAGATRYFTPRSMTIVDLVGLNDGEAARLHFDRDAKLCHFVRRRPTHLLLPSEWAPAFEPVFELVPLAHFDDPYYTQTWPPHARGVRLFAVGRIRDPWRRRCTRS